MHVSLLYVLRVSFVLTFALATGCGGGKAADPKGNGHAEHEHAAEESGPHGGHLLTFDKPGYKAEWLHDKTGVIVIILDAEGKKEVSVAGEKAVIDVGIGTESGNVVPVEYPLEPLNTGGDPPKTSRFGLENRELIAHLGMHAMVKTTFIIDIDGKTYTGEMAHHHHGHKH